MVEALPWCGDVLTTMGWVPWSLYLATLNENAVPSGDRLIGESFIMKQDNAPCHKE